MDAEGYSPLHYACILRHHGILRLLLKSGVDVCVGDKDGLTALHWACLQLDITSLKMISENISDVEIYCKRGYSPLYLACVLGRDAYGEIDYAVLRECIYCLISKGANIDFQDEFGYFIIQHVMKSWADWTDSDDDDEDDHYEYDEYAHEGDDCHYFSSHYF